MNILVLNCGSSTVRFELIETDLSLIEQDADRSLFAGRIERIGSESIITTRVEGQRSIVKTAPIRDHKTALDFILRMIIDPETGIPGIKSITDIAAVGHRVVHGGEKFSKSVVITEEVIEEIENCIELAPLHNPANLKGIYAVHKIFGHGIPQVAVFDTAFHASIPEHAYLFAIPYQLYRRHKIRRYGFHGTSHRYIGYRYRKIKNLERKKVNIISMHLGNGCSICAIQGGNSIDTSMGLTPLDGLVMGTRSGDVDPSVLQFLTLKEGFTLPEVEAMLNKQSGLLGLSGLTNDMRELLEEAHLNDDRRANLAIDIFCYRIRKYIGSYMSIMDQVDALAFTGGIGENAAEVRAKICAGLEKFGLALDPKVNDGTSNKKEMKISTKSSKIEIWVIPTNEELLIARDTVRSINTTSDEPSRIQI